MELGKRIKLYRNLFNLTQKEFADKIHISEKTLSAYERDYTEPSLEVIKIMASFFNITVDELIGYKNPDAMDLANDDFLFALYGETKDLTDNQKADILDFVKKAVSMMKK